MPDPRLLFIATQFPFPPRNGITNKTANYLWRLPERFRITLLSYASEAELSPGALEEAANCCEQVVTLGRQARSFGRALLHGAPPVTSRYRTAEARASLRALCAARSFEVVHVDDYGALWLRGALNAGRAVVVASVNDLYSLMLEHLPQPSWWSRLAASAGVRLVRAYERRWFPKFDQVHFVTDVDCDHARRVVPGASVHRVPIGVDPGTPAAVEEEPDTLVFVADMSGVHGTQILGFVRHAWPLVRRQLPEARLYVVGPHAPTELIQRSRSDSGLRVMGFVSDPRQFMGRASLALSINPLPGGMHNKALEAMAMAKAVVGYPHNFAAIDGAVDGRHFIGATSWPELAQRVVAALQAPASRRRIGEAARQLVAERCSWDGVIARYLELIDTGSRHRAQTGARRSAPRA